MRKQLANELTQTARPVVKPDPDRGAFLRGFSRIADSYAVGAISAKECDDGFAEEATSAEFKRHLPGVQLLTREETEMPAPVDPLEVLKRLSSSYEALAAGFKAFHAGVARLSDDAASPIKQNTVVSNLQADSFHVDFCGRKYQFDFRTAVDDLGPLGTVTCSDVDGNASNSFVFRPSGWADVEKPAGHSSPLAVNDPAGAIYLCSRCLMRCLAVPGGSQRS